MKKEEQQKNKSDEKISFFENTEKIEETWSFFGQIKNFFKNKNNYKAVIRETKKSPIRNSTENKPSASTESKNKIIPKKSDEVAVNNLPKEIVADKAAKAEGKKVASSRQSKAVPNWSASNILSTNLIKGESTLTYHWDKKILILLANAILVVFVVGLAYGGLLYWEKTGKIANEELDKRANNLKRKIDDLKKEAEEINLFNKKIVLANNLLDKHIHWNNFFEFLENNILTDVYLENKFSGGVNGQYIFRAHTKDLKTMLDQVNYLRQSDKRDKILSVEIADIVTSDMADASGEIKATNEKYKVSFDLILSVNKNIFYKK